MTEKVLTVIVWCVLGIGVWYVEGKEITVFLQFMSMCFLSGIYFDLNKED